MEIERINENTLKLSISYIDIEQRGFQRDEIWYNRERSEELFWEVMDEINEDFNPNGPLWIQVQALEKGLEIIVTQAQVPNLADVAAPFLSNLEPLINLDPLMAPFKQQSMFESADEGEIEDESSVLEFVFVFKDFEDLIEISALMTLDEIQTKLYSLKEKYYLLTNFNEVTSEESIDNKFSILLEYSEEAKLTPTYLMEYGKIIINENVFSNIRTYFH